MARVPFIAFKSATTKKLKKREVFGAVLCAMCVTINHKLTKRYQTTYKI